MPMISAFAMEEKDAQTDLLNALSALAFTGRYSDLTITCNYRQWAVHRAIVCSRSGFFDGVCSNPCLESTSGIIDLSEDDEEAVEQMIHFFYHLDYLDNPEEPRATAFRHRARADLQRKQYRQPNFLHIEDPLLSQAGCYMPKAPATPPPSSPTESRNSFEFPIGKPCSPETRTDTPQLVSDSESDYESMSEDDEIETESHLLLHTRVYSLAEKYDIPSLKQLARRKFEVAMACHYDSPEFADAIEEVYCSTIDSDRGLRGIVLEAFRSHPQLANTQDVFTVIKETPTLAMELFKVERGIPV